MGSGRSVDKACKLSHANKGIDRGSARRTGSWSGWCNKFDWVERAREYDHMMAEERRRELAESKRKRWHKHSQFLADNQATIHQLIRDLITNLDKLLKGPITEITRVQLDNATNTKSTIKTKAPGIGELSKALNDTLSRENLSYNQKDEPEVEERVIERVVWAKSKKNGSQPVSEKDKAA
jgi:hypothetical protein